jgi:hypothetical protein
MNVLRDYNPRLFEILGIPYHRASKAHLGKIIDFYVVDNNYDIHVPDTADRYIDLFPESVRELTGIYDKDRYYFFINGVPQYTWWDFVTLIYKRWKI